MNENDSIAEEVEAIRARLDELEEQKSIGLDSITSDELNREEHRLMARLHELSDKTAEEGLAEALVKDEGANADEYPEMPPSGENDRRRD